MAMRGWFRRSRRGTLAVSDAAFASMRRLRRVRFGVPRQPMASHETLRSEDADLNCLACSAFYQVAEQARRSW